MGKKGRKTAAPPKTMSKRQLSRHERDQKLNRYARIGAVAVAVILVAVLAFGWYREVLAKPGEAIATVNGTEISLGEYAKMLGHNGDMLNAQEAQLQNNLAQSPSGSTSQNSAQQAVQQQLQQLESERSLLPADTLNQMIEEELIRQEATRRGIVVSSQEVDDSLVKQFSAASSPAASGVVTGTQGVTSTVPPTQTTQTIAQVNAGLKQFLGHTGFLTVDEYRQYVVEPSILRQKLQTAMGAEIKTSGEQVHARHILVDTEAQAQDVLKMLKDQHLDFAAVAKQMSQDTVTKDKGGDLGWFPRGIMTKAFDDAAFKLPVGQLSNPVQTDYGYDIIRVDERAANRPLTADQLTQLRDGVLIQWLADQKKPEAHKVQQFDTPDHLKWANDFVTNQLNQAIKRSSATPVK